MNPSTAARALGIDFGTSNSTVGWWRPEVEPLIELEDGKITLPSVVFFNVEERRPVYGRQALGEYLEGYEGRLMRSLKSLLGSKLLKSETTVLGSALPFKDLLGLFIGQLKARGEAAAGQAFDAVVLGRPVFFVDDDPEADREAQDTLVQVANKLGFKEVSFQYEPIAAAFDYERGIQREELVLIVDIGGGTSDFSLVRLAPERRNLAERQDDILAAVRAAFRRCAGASRRCCPTPVMSRATCSAASAAAWPSRRRSAMAEPPWSCPCPIGG